MVAPSLVSGDRSPSEDLNMNSHELQTEEAIKLFKDRECQCFEWKDCIITNYVRDVLIHCPNNCGKRLKRSCSEKNGTCSPAHTYHPSTGATGAFAAPQVLLACLLDPSYSLSISLFL